MTAWPVLEIELLWIVSLLNQDLANTCQIHQNTPITCHHKFQPDECVWKSTLRCIAFRHFPNVTFIRLCLDPSSLHFFPAMLPSWHHLHQTPSLRIVVADVVAQQIQVRQGGVLLQGLGQSLAGDTWLKKRDEAQGRNQKPYRRAAKSPQIDLLLSKIRVLGSKTKWNNQSPWLIIDTMPCQSVVYFA